MSPTRGFSPFINQYLQFSLGFNGHGQEAWRTHAPYHQSFFNKSYEVMPQVKSGKIVAKRDIERCEGNRIYFTDGSAVLADVMVTCSGYKLVAPFFEPGMKADPQQCYKYLFGTEPSVAFVGFVRPVIGSIPAIAELQSRYAAMVFVLQRSACPADRLPSAVLEAAVHRAAQMVVGGLVAVERLPILAQRRVPPRAHLRHLRALSLQSGQRGLYPTGAGADPAICRADQPYPPVYQRALRVAEAIRAAERRVRRRCRPEAGGARRVIESRSPTDLVLALVRVVNGEAPRLAAREILDPMVEIRMDSTDYCGIDAWYKWIHLIRNCGRVADLRMTQCRARCDARDPSLVHLSARWTGTIRSRRIPGMAAADGEVRYLIRDGRIKKIWTRKSNYEFIFGRWIRYSICFRLFLAWSVLYFAVLSLRKKDFLADLG